MSGGERGPTMPRPARLLRPRLRARVIGFLVIALIGLLYFKPLRSYLSTRGEVQRRSAEVRELRREKAALERRVARNETGRELLRQARRLELVKPGERLYIVKGIAAWRRSNQARRG